MATGTYPLNTSEPTPEQIAQAAAWDRTRADLPALLSSISDGQQTLAVYVALGHIAERLIAVEQAVGIVGAQALADANAQAV